MNEYVSKLRIGPLKLPNLSNGAMAKVASMANAALDASSDSVFELSINPEQYTRNFTVHHTRPAEIGPSQNQAHSQFNRVTPEILEIRFTIDGTGVVPIQSANQSMAATTSVDFVTNKLAHLKKVVYGIQDETHRPPFIVVNWGKLVFMGVLQSMTQNFTLFHSTGVPLRVEVSLKIEEFKSPNKAAAANSLQSPDLTKRRTINASDTILTLTKTIYDKTDYYLEVAKANELTNFRKLKTNTELLFPPVV